MPIVKFPFQPQVEYDPFIKKIVGIVYQPKVPIFLKINGVLYPFRLEPHVDSGATRNLFPSDPLDSLSIKLENGHKRLHLGIGGHEVISYTHEVEILIDNYSFVTEIDFSRKHKPPLLGIESFFSFFDYVHFNMLDKQLELKYTLLNDKDNPKSIKIRN